VILSSNSGLLALVWAEWSLAWSSVAVSAALADACFNAAATRTEAGELALWKRVMVSSVLGCEDSLRSALGGPIGHDNATREELDTHESEHDCGFGFARRDLMQLEMGEVEGFELRLNDDVVLQPGAWAMWRLLPRYFSVAFSRPQIFGSIVLTEINMENTEIR